MKTLSTPMVASAEARASAVARYQIFSQTRTGVFAAGFQSNSAGEAVEAFLKQAPAFEGGDIRLWNHRAQELSASVEWRKERTGVDGAVYHRTDHFHDRLLGVIARLAQQRVTLRAEVREDAVLSMAL